MNPLTDLTLVITYDTTASFCLGGGLYYALEQKKSYHIPFIIACPTVYAILIIFSYCIF